LKAGVGLKVIKIFNDNKGLTLIELLVSITILGIVLLSFMNFFLQAGTYTNLNQKKTVAINVARNVMMFMEKQSYLDTRNFFYEVNSGDTAPDQKYYKLYICNHEYQIFENDKAPCKNSSLISINDLDYTANIFSESVPGFIKDEENTASGKTDVIQQSDYYIPITVEIRWKIDDREYHTELDGKIKSEDIR
jgi:prepilin-type N-terminal cleavage/methylation domain-containing protein